MTSLNGIVPLRPDHFTRVNYRSDHQEYCMALGEWNQAIEASLLRSGGFALEVGGSVLALAGVTPFWPNVGQFWMRVGVESGAKWFSLARIARPLMHLFVQTLQYRRFQATVRVDNLKAVRFAEWLGFMREGLMRGYGPEGADYLMMAMVSG